MGNYICLNNAIITILTAFLFIGCTPAEPMLELQLERQMIGEPFSFADYCEEKYDSIYIIQPYEEEDVIYSLPYKMSNRLRGKCSYTLDDTFVRILFIDKDIVKAYAEIPAIDAYFTIPNNRNIHIFPFEQKFMMDKRRFVYIYNE